MYVLVILVYLVIASIEIYSFYQKKQKKEMVFFSVTMAFSLVISILILAGVELPQPARIIEKILPGTVK